MMQSYKKKEKELEDMIETIKEDEKKKATDARNEFSAYFINILDSERKPETKRMKKQII